MSDEITTSDAGIEPSRGLSGWSWQHPSTKAKWVFGLDWMPTLTSRSERLLYRHLRQQGQAWHVSHGQGMRLIGVAGSAELGASPRQSASAALAFVASKPKGSHALCVEVSGRGFWFVACHEGRLLSQTDCWLAESAELDQLLGDLTDRHEALQCEHVSWPTAADEPLPAALTFLQAKPKRAWCFQRVPSGRLPWMILTAVIAGATGCVLAWIYLSVDEPVRENAVTSVRAPLVPLTHHDPQAVLSLLTLWQPLPVDPVGWRLAGVQCRPIVSHVGCIAAYERHSRSADNEGLIAHAPNGWRFEAVSLDRALLKRQFALDEQSVPDHRLPSDLDALTQLQRHSGQIASLDVGERKQLDSMAPDQALAVKRSLHIRLALRQAEHLLAWSLPVRWRHIHLDLVRGAQVDERHGYLMLDLKGDLFEKN